MVRIPGAILALAMMSEHPCRVDVDSFGADKDAATVADLARQFGHHAGRAWFSGARADESRGLVTIYRVPNRAFDDELRLMVGDSVPLEFQDALHTRDELIVARETAWTFAESLQIEAITIPDDGSGINVYVHVPVATAQQTLDRFLPHIAKAVDASAGVLA